MCGNSFKKSMKCKLQRYTILLTCGRCFYMNAEKLISIFNYSSTKMKLLFFQQHDLGKIIVKFQKHKSNLHVL